MAATNGNGEELDQWSQRLSQALQILDLKVEPQEILGMFNRISSQASPGAGALAAFYVGYAAASDARADKGAKSSDEAVRDAVATAERVAGSGPDSVGFAATGQ